ncbi:MAG: hypothetical protein DWB43_04995 [Lautropia sp.]|nr:MAG: hypothetical protein EDM78_03150 [Pseudomonadota bacterium]MBC6958876.1 hypothetical protein [Lautropia sp.]MCL4701023.1 MliC family protein [Burkholderiaceae bacterium]MDL1907891.1 hypothetical protein [Betaproteobacteria bacterium PRO1]RIK90420.1 MAG: hypothetical protein DCC70_04075 [Burkholderiales bacterium]
MRSITQSSTLAAFVLGASLASAPMPAASADQAGFNPHGFKLPTGVYRCDLNRSVNVREVSADMSSAVVQFDKKEYRMHAVGARSGALRYEDAQSGLVWLVIATKSMLLDTKHGRQLANECKT